MVILAPHKTERYLKLDTYTSAWKIGTGLPDSLPPGLYRVTGQDCVEGATYVFLDNSYRVPTDQNSCICDLTESQINEQQTLEFRIRNDDVISTNLRSSLDSATL